MTSRSLAEPLAPVGRLRGVRAAVVTTLEDALPITSLAHVDVDVDALAALAAALVRRSAEVARAAGAGELTLMTLDAERGRLLVAARGPLLLAALADRDANQGLVRVALLRALEALD